MQALVIMVLVLCEVACWQWRVALTIRGNVLAGVLLALVGAVIQVTVISQVVHDMGDVAKVAGYAVGVATGVLLGCLIDRRVSEWSVLVRVFAPADPTLVPALRAAGWPVTATSGDGHQGPVDVLYLAIDRRHTADLERNLLALAPGACWTIERISASQGLLTVAAA